jgi:hypothetical protein
LDVGFEAAFITRFVSVHSSDLGDGGKKPQASSVHACNEAAVHKVVPRLGLD